MLRFSFQLQACKLLSITEGAPRQQSECFIYPPDCANNMRTATRSLSISLVILFLGSLLSGAAIELNKESMPTELAQEPAVMEAVSPGYPVFAEYMGAHWCGPCHQASANLDSLYGTNGGGGTTSEDFTYISFWESPSTGNPNLSFDQQASAHPERPGVR